VKVTEMYAITNNSRPPVTQAGAHNYEIVLPEKAVIDSVQARRGEGVWTKVPPEPEQGKPGHYSINFPFRPGDTLIRFTYHMPGAGPVALHLKLPYPILKFAVMHPPSIKFKAARAGAFTSPGQANGFKIEAAVKQPMVGDVPAFEISGVGMASPPVAAAGAPPVQPPSVSAPPVTGVAPNAAPPNAAAGQSAAAAAIPSAEPKRESWLMALAIAGLLMIGAVAFWRMRAASPQPAAAAPPLLEALKEELFQLEIDKAKGSISPDEYTATKQALNTTMQRAAEKGKR
jgi:hypothetical protein